jgi:hypothetical protein
MWGKGFPCQRKTDGCLRSKYVPYILRTSTRKYASAYATCSTRSRPSFVAVGRRMTGNHPQAYLLPHRWRKLSVIQFIRTCGVGSDPGSTFNVRAAEKPRRKTFFGRRTCTSKSDDDRQTRSRQKRFTFTKGRIQMEKTCHCDME